jgi:hypothetical protein
MGGYPPRSSGQLRDILMPEKLPAQTHTPDQQVDELAEHVGLRGVEETSTSVTAGVEPLQRLIRGLSSSVSATEGPRVVEMHDPHQV